VDIARFGIPGLGADLEEHLDIVGALEAVHEQQGLGLGLAKSILQLVGSVGGIDVDHDYARFGRGELGDDPLSQVGGPDGQAVALLQAQGHEAFGGAVQLLLQLTICVTFVLVDGDDCIVIGIFFRYFIEHIPDGLSNKRLFRAAKSITVRDFAWHEVGCHTLGEYNSILRRLGGIKNRGEDAGR